MKREYIKPIMEVSENITADTYLVGASANGLSITVNDNSDGLSSSDLDAKGRGNADDFGDLW